MSKEQEFKLLSKEEIEKNRIKAYKYIDMSKEQTIEEGLKEVLEVIDGNGVPNMNWVRNKLKELLIKEKEQREEKMYTLKEMKHIFDVGRDSAFQEMHYDEAIKYRDREIGKMD